MSKPMHVDWAVPQESLADPVERRRIKVQMFRELQAHGYVDPASIRLLRDVPDGPFVDGSISVQPGYVPVRMVAHVTPVRRI